MLLREDYLSKIRGFYDSDLIKILVGIRRCGNIEFEELLDYKKLNKYIKDKIKDDKIYYLFLDEIQNVDNFEKVVNSLHAQIKNNNSEFSYIVYNELINRN